MLRSWGRPARHHPDIPQLLTEFGGEGTAEIEPDLGASKLAADDTPRDAVVVAKVSNLAEKRPGDRSGDDAGMAIFEPDHEHRSRLASLPDHPADQSQEGEHDQ